MRRSDQTPLERVKAGEGAERSLVRWPHFIVRASTTAPPDSRRSGRTFPRFATVLAVVAGFALAAAGAAQDVSTQFWPEVDTFVRLNRNMRIYVPASRTKEGADDSDQDGTVGAYLDYFVAPMTDLHLLGPSNETRMHRLLLRMGYGYTAGSGGDPATHTLTAEATWRMTIPWEILLSDRNRFDLNWTGGDFDPRYRNRIRVDRNVDFGTWALNPYAYGEFFYDFDDGAWLKTRATVGLEVHVWDRVVPEIYFQRDYGKGPGSTNDVRGVGLVVSIYLN